MMVLILDTMKHLEKECNDIKSVMDLIIKLNKQEPNTLLSERVEFFCYLSEEQRREYTCEDEERLRKIFEQGKLEYDESYQFSTCQVDVDFQTFNFHNEINHLLRPTFDFEDFAEGLTPIAKFEVLLLNFLQMIPYDS